MHKKLLIQVSMAHLVSHLHIMTIPALLPILPQAMDVSFIQLGMAIGVFNVVSALVQAPLGFMVDRVGAKAMLIGALIVGSLSFALLAIWPTFPMLLLVMCTAGLANGVYHPADYALLSQSMEPERMGRAFSIHTFAGFTGAALAPPVLLGLAQLFDIRWAFIFSSGVGIIALFLFLLSIDLSAIEEPNFQTSKDSEKRPLATPIIRFVSFVILFMLLSLSTGAIEKFSVSALVEGFSVPLLLANQGLTAFLCFSAFGVLVGGYLADRTARHGYLAAGAFFLAAFLVVLITIIELSSVMLVIFLGLIGFLTGLVAPSRDMLVRAASPKGAEGRVFGIASTGFNIGGVLGPLFLGCLLDLNLSKGIFWSAAVFMILTSVLMLRQEYRNINQLITTSEEISI